MHAKIKNKSNLSCVHVGKPNDIEILIIKQKENKIKIRISTHFIMMMIMMMIIMMLIDANNEIRTILKFKNCISINRLFNV